MSTNEAKRVKSSLKDIAQSTLGSIKRGSYTTIDGRRIDLGKGMREMKEGTVFFGEDSELANWRRGKRGVESEAKVEVVACSTLAGVRRLDDGEGRRRRGRIGVLSFGSAKNPGGGFMNGAQAQVCVCVYVCAFYVMN